MRSFPKEKIPLPPDFRPLGLNPHLPIDVEIGCGVGFHPLRYAAENPERQLVAIERTKEKFQKFLRRLQNHPSLPNLFPIHGDAIPWITHSFGVGSVHRYFILYPNPYPKERQRNLRFHQMPFFSFLKETLMRGGELVLATNEKFYASEAEALSGEGMVLVEKKILPQSFSPRTHFEKKYLARGEECWNLVFRKIH